MSSQTPSQQQFPQNEARLLRQNSGRRKSTLHTEFIQQGGYRPEFVSQNSSTNLQNLQSTQKIWKLMGKYLPCDKETIQSSVVNHVEYTLAKTRFDFTLLHCYQAVSHSVRDRLIEAFNDTYAYFTAKDTKYVYYLSLEYLIGRCLQNALVNIELESQYKDAMLEFGYNIESIYEQELDPALGNGGLGRLAACFLDSLATLNYPAWGYGLRYNYGIFRQQIKDGYQVEVPDYWLDRGNPWEIERLDVNYPIRFYGNVSRRLVNGREQVLWEGGEVILARAYDNPIPGYNTFNTICLRLWRSLPSSQFDFSSFNQGDYFKALESRQRAEFITSVLYPNDSTYAGKELRLKQQYLLVSATIQDAIRRFKKKEKEWKQWPAFNALQLNDTHPALAIVELMRILIDVEQLDYESAWEIVYNSFAYTNHTILPEALEKWGTELLQNLLPRHLEIIYTINHIFMEKIAKKFPNDFQKLSALSLVEEGAHKSIRMANLSIVGSHAVNGVAALHSKLLITSLFKDFYDLRPAKFQNKTNGVTPRRWVRCANPGLSNLLNEIVGSDEWILDMDILKKCERIVDDPAIQQKWMHIKRQNKEKLYWWVKDKCGIDLNIDSLFDIQVKRIHEYKRQLMNILYVIRRYLDIKKTPAEDRRKLFVPRSIMFGGKAAPGYVSAKRIIRLINAVSQKVNNDQDIGDLLKVVFLPNYNVSNAQIIIPASELSQHISTAGLEASGTSNMKFVMNGCLIIGTMDGANVEIAEEVGEENMFIFGARVEQVEELRQKMRSQESKDYFGPRLNEVIEAISSDLFGYRYELEGLLDTIRNKNDFYILGADFESYCQAQQKVDNLYRNKVEWTKKSILNSLRSGKFSSDRTIKQYADEIWNLTPCEAPNPSKSEKERYVSNKNIAQ